MNISCSKFLILQEKHDKMHENLRSRPKNAETRKCRKTLQYWAFEKKYKTYMEI